MFSREISGGISTKTLVRLCPILGVFSEKPIKISLSRSIYDSNLPKNTHQICCVSWKYRHRCITDVLQVYYTRWLSSTIFIQLKTQQKRMNFSLFSIILEFSASRLYDHKLGPLGSHSGYTASLITLFHDSLKLNECDLHCMKVISTFKPRFH